MPTVRFVTSVAGVGFEHHTGDEVEMSPDAARQAVAAGWGELVRGRPAEIPEARTARPETPEGATRSRRARS